MQNPDHKNNFKEADWSKDVISKEHAKMDLHKIAPTGVTVRKA